MGYLYDLFIDEVKGALGTNNVCVLKSDPDMSELSEGQMWILTSNPDTNLTAPLIQPFNATDDSIAFALTNPSYDENGIVIREYYAYINDVLHDVIYNGFASEHILNNLVEFNKYSVKIRGVKNGVLSDMSNVCNVIPIGYTCLSGVRVTNSGNSMYSLSEWHQRACAVAEHGDYPLLSDAHMIQDNEYYYINIPSTVSSVTVVCDGLYWGFSGFNIGESGDRSYDVDSGWLSSGAVYEFDLAVVTHGAFTFKRTDDGAVLDEDMANVRIVFA